MTNCIMLGEIGGGSSASMRNVVQPTEWPFQSADDGNYYLPAGSAYHQAGTTNISAGMLAELPRKTTYAPISFPPGMAISNQLTLFPQAGRYTNGAPDLGYAYDPLDYTIGDMLLMGGAITVLRGAAIGFRNDFFGSLGLGNNSVFTAQGTPTRPIAFVDNSLVQEGPFAPGVVYNEFNTLLDEGGVQPYGGQAFFVPATAQDDTSDAAPVLNLRFCDFYMTADDFGIQAGGLPQIGFFSDSGGPLSAASSVVWTMRDCAVYGGQLDLGGETEGSTNAPGSVTWINNLFEGTFITLAPSGVDLPFQAHNNLFRKGILCLTPVSTSQGNWVMKDNLFDQMWFWQSGQGTLNHNYNAYWTNSVPYDMDVSLFGESYFTSLLGSEANGHVLTSAPSYQAGPFGNYYMAPGTVLAGTGSTTADQLGLYHYTTATNQTAEVNSRVDIGLHYLVASNSASGWVPLDTDGDGIPDYVEDANGNGATGAAAVVLGETDWQNPMTDGVNYDPSNAVYLNIDLAGGGIVGGVKSALGIDPLATTNSLTLTQIITGQEPDIVTFEVPINYNLVTNAGDLELWVDGSMALSQVCEPATDGNCLLIWSADYTGWNQIDDGSGNAVPLDWHHIQARFALASIPQNALNTLSDFSGWGPPLVLNQHNPIRFSQAHSSFASTGTVLYANVSEMNANYTITLYDDASGSWIDTISGSTTSGEISENWEGTYHNGSSYTGSAIDAVFSASFPGSGTSANATLPLSQQTATDCEGCMLVACAWDEYDSATVAAFNTAIGLGMVDPTLNPGVFGLYGDPYCAGCPWDVPSYGGLGGSCGYLPTQAWANSLIPYFGNNTHNFFFEGHGQNTSIGNDIPPTGANQPPNPNSVVINDNTIQGLLSNGWFNIRGHNVWKASHPYRFVFLDACHTAETPAWTQTFGIPENISYNDITMGTSVQAFVGWVGSPRAPADDTDWYNYCSTLQCISEGWMSNFPLQTVLTMASKSDPFGNGSVTLQWPLGLHYTMLQIILNPLKGYRNNFYYRIYGYPGITRTGFE